LRKKKHAHKTSKGKIKKTLCSSFLIFLHLKKKKKKKPKNICKKLYSISLHSGKYLQASQPASFFKICKQPVPKTKLSMLLAHSAHSLRCQKGSCVQSAPNHPPNTKSDQIMNKENKIKEKTPAVIHLYTHRAGFLSFSFS
jgi:hypothetical protein